MGRGRKHTNYVSIATLQDNAITPPVVAIATATATHPPVVAIATASVATLQDSDITPPVVAIATASVATLQDKAIGSFLESFAATSTTPVRSSITTRPPVGATIGGVGITTPPVGAIASAIRGVKPAVEEDLTSDIEFANAMQHSNHSEKSAKTYRVVTSARPSTSASARQIITLPVCVDNYLHNLCAFCYDKDAAFISWMCSSDEENVLHASGKLMEYHKLTFKNLNYANLTLSQNFYRVWLFYFHDIGFTVYINADNTTFVRIGHRNGWLQEYNASDSIEMLCKCLSDYNTNGLVPFSVHPRLFEPTRMPQPPFHQQPFNRKHDDFPALGLKVENTVVPPVAPQVASASGMSRTSPVVASASGMYRTSPTVASASSMSRTSPAVASAYGMSRTSLTVASASGMSRTALAVASASGMSRTALTVAPSVARIFASTVVAQVAVAPVAVAPVAVAPVAVAPAVAPEVAPEDPERLAFKKQQANAMAIAMEKFDLIQNHKKMILASEAKLAADIAALGVDKQS